MYHKVNDRNWFIINVVMEMQHNKLYIYSHFVVSGSVYEKIDSCLHEFSEMNLKGGDINASTFQGAVYFIH